jgi:hypothetical protein
MLYAHSPFRTHIVGGTPVQKYRQVFLAGAARLELAIS